MFCSISYGRELIFDIETPRKGIYVYKTLFVEGNYAAHGDIFPANISFLNNYSAEVNGGYYRLDNIASGERIPKPPNPERTGYEFAGWFTESSCVNAWDFDIEPSIPENTEFKLYANWHAI